MKLFLKFSLSLFLVVSLLGGGLVVQAADKIMYVSSKNDIILRDSASKNAKQIAKIPNNSKVTVTSTKKEWSLIKYNNKKGYVYTTALTNTPPKATPPVVSSGLGAKGGLTLTYNPSFDGESKEVFTTKAYGDITHLYSNRKGADELAYATWDFWGKKYFSMGVAETSFDYFNFGYPMVENKYTESLSFSYDSEGEEVVDKEKILIESTSKTIKTKAGTFKNTVILKDTSGFRYYLVKGYGVIKITKKDGTVVTELVSIKK